VIGFGRGFPPRNVRNSRPLYYPRTHPALPARAGRVYLPVDDPAAGRLQRAAHRQGGVLGHRRARAGDAAAAGAGGHDPHRAAHRSAHRPRPAVGRPRDRGDAGLRHQHLPAAAPRPPAGRAHLGRDLLHHDRGRPDGQPDVPRDRLRHHLRPRRERDQAPRLLRGLPQSRPLRRRCAGRRRLARVLPRGHLAAEPAHRLHGGGLPAGHRPGQAHRGPRPCTRRAARRDTLGAGEVRGRPLRGADPGAGPQHGLPCHGDPQGRQRDDDPGAGGPRRRTPNAGSLAPRPDDGPAPQVRAARGVPRPRADRPGPRRPARARRQARGLRPRHRRRVRVLRHPVSRPADGQRPDRAAVAGRLGAQPGAGPGRWRPAVLAGSVRRQADPADPAGPLAGRASWS
jgi:hypothetical protein